jgi:hypothetical protein
MSGTVSTSTCLRGMHKDDCTFLFVASPATSAVRAPAVVFVRLVTLAVPGLAHCADRRDYGPSFNWY